MAAIASVICSAPLARAAVPARASRAVAAPRTFFSGRVLRSAAVKVGWWSAHLHRKIPFDGLARVARGPHPEESSKLPCPFSSPFAPSNPDFDCRDGTLRREGALLGGAATHMGGTRGTVLLHRVLHGSYS